MDSASEREIVVEFEHVQLVRTRTKSVVAVCRECSATSDFLEFGKAVRLFRTDEANFSRFVTVNRCHTLEVGWTTKLICFTSLIAAMKSEKVLRRVGRSLT